MSKSRVEYRILPTKWAVFKFTIEKSTDLHEQMSNDQYASRHAEQCCPESDNYGYLSTLRNNLTNS
jgi:hypothetical protein